MNPLPEHFQRMAPADLRDQLNAKIHALQEAHDSAERWRTSYDGAMRENKNQQHAYNLMKIESEKNADLLAVRDSEILALQTKLIDQEEALLKEREERRAKFINRHENEARHLWSTTFTAAIRNGDSGTQASHKADDGVYQFNLKFQPKAPALPHE